MKYFDTLAQADKNGGRKLMKDTLNKRRDLLIACSVLEGGLSICLGIDAFLSGMGGIPYAIQLGLATLAFVSAAICIGFDSKEVVDTENYLNQ
jgi:hypothetical protein